MGYVACKLQNASEYGGDVPDIVITEYDPEWEVAFARWKNGQDPTDSPLWKKGVICVSRVKR